MLPVGRKANWSAILSHEMAGRSQRLTTYFSRTHDNIGVTEIDIGLKSERAEAGRMRHFNIDFKIK